MYMYIYIYIYTYVEREREREICCLRCYCSPSCLGLCVCCPAVRMNASNSYFVIVAALYSVQTGAGKACGMITRIWIGQDEPRRWLSIEGSHQLVSEISYGREQDSERSIYNMVALITWLLR